MQRKTSTIPKATIARLVMNAGAKRVSEPAVKALAEIVEEISLKIGSRAVEIARHSGRKTVHESDVKLAAKN
jgi:histone H3/H4